MSAKIIVKNLKKTFQNKEVLRDVSLSVNQGESLVILGGSGSGKSVLIKLISGLISPTSGNVIIDDISTTSISDVKRDKLMEKFGFLFQGGALFDSLTIWENVAFRLINHQQIEKKIAQKKRIIVRN